MTAALPTIDIEDVETVDTLPDLTREVAGSESPYLAHVRKALEMGKGIILPNAFATIGEGGSKTNSEYAAVVRELRRAARQAGVNMTTRKVLKGRDGNALPAGHARVGFAVYTGDTPPAAANRPAPRGRGTKAE